MLDKYTEWPLNDLKCYKVKDTWYCMFCYSPWVPILCCQPFLSYPVLVIATLRQEHEMTPNNLEQNGVKVPHISPTICSTLWIPNFNLFHCTVSHFTVTDHFETCALNESKMNTTCVRGIPYNIYSTSIHESQILICLTPWSAIFKLHVLAILRCALHWMTSNDLEQYEVKGMPHRFYLLSTTCPVRYLLWGLS